MSIKIRQTLSGSEKADSENERRLRIRNKIRSILAEKQDRASSASTSEKASTRPKIRLRCSQEQKQRIVLAAGKERQPSQQGLTIRKQIKSKISNALTQNCSRGLRSSKSTLLKRVALKQPAASPMEVNKNESTLEADTFEETKKIQQLFSKPFAEEIKDYGVPIAK